MSSTSGIGRGIEFDNSFYDLEKKVEILEAKVAHITDYLCEYVDTKPIYTKERLARVERATDVLKGKQEQIIKEQIKKHTRRINLRKEREMSNCLQKEMEELEDIADARCTCTVAQQEGTDPTMCKSCEASHIINDLGEDLRHGLGKLKKL